jgi:hypothetical protein
MLYFRRFSKRLGAVIVVLCGKSGELLRVSRADFDPLGVMDLYGLSSRPPRFGLTRGELLNCEYLGLPERALSVEDLGGLDVGFDGTVKTGL